MRPSLLNPLFATVDTLPGVGPKVGELLGKLLGKTEDDPALVRDLLFHLPVAVIDRSSRPGIARAPEGAIATFEVRVDRHQPGPPRGRAPHRVFVHDDTGEMALVFFHANRGWLEKMLPVGKRVVVSGTVEWFNGRPQMVHPDHIVDAGAADALPKVEPIYPMTAGLARKTLLKAMAGALDAIPKLPEWLPAERIAADAWPSFATALMAAHQPADPADLEALSPHRARLAFDEIYADQLALALTRAHMRRSAGIARRGDGRIAKRLRAALPFALTGSQETALAEINADLAKPERMLRLLQGDVGAGKTVVALLAMATAVESGAQAALMAPTDILARQHFETIAPIAEQAGLRVALLTGRDRAGDRRRILAELAGTPPDAGLFAGEPGAMAAGRGIDILIGTHALFQEGVVFRNLGLAVVDEQHRFGVQQRLALAAKGEATDILVMTATPIPRSLVLTAFGDMEVSALREKPAGRKPIETRVISAERLAEIVDRIAAVTRQGERAFWVCPLVEESEAAPLTAVSERAASLAKALGRPVGLVHGQMLAAEKDAQMERFRRGEVPVLVATTVIEVGVDVPEATIMVVEHAERFGLAQLHQLRGRIGRGSKPSACVLLYHPPLGMMARRRLETLRETEDGFRIAEEDLRLRGEGDLLGTRQSGLPDYRLANLEFHQPLLEAARQDARREVTADPDLVGARGPAMRALLYLFGRDSAVRLLRAG